MNTRRISRCGCVWKVSYDESYNILNVEFIDIYDRAALSEDMKLFLLQEYAADHPTTLQNDIQRRDDGLDPY